MRIASALIISTGVLLAGSAAAAVTLPQLTSYTVTSVGLKGTGLRLSVSGSLDCTRHADFHLDLWVYQSTTGALARASVPASRGAHPSKKKLIRLKRSSACLGSAQSWSVKASAAPTSGKHHTPFVAGPAQVCSVVDVGKHLRYMFQSTCVQTTITKR